VLKTYYTTQNLHYAEIGDAVCVYNPHTLNTHILPDETVALLEILKQKPMGLHCLAQRFSEQFDTRGIDDFASMLQKRVVELVGLGLLEEHADQAGLQML
jgi:PqqD family protein of HPr-rel-A system